MQQDLGVDLEVQALLVVVLVVGYLIVLAEALQEDQVIPLQLVHLKEIMVVLIHLELMNLVVVVEVEQQQLDQLVLVFLEEMA